MIFIKVNFKILIKECNLKKIKAYIFIYFLEQNFKFINLFFVNFYYFMNSFNHHIFKCCYLINFYKNID